VSTTPAASPRRDTLLVVDDTPETLSFLVDTLDHAGYTVLIATDGESALELLQQVTPDLVLLDAVMPGLGGFETCRRLKRDRAYSYLPVIFMTGLTATEHVVEGLSAGGVDYVTKPIDIDPLLARIRVHLANARSAIGSQAALDASGRFLLATDRQGGLLWCTPKARALLSAPVGASAAPATGAAEGDGLLVAATAAIAALLRQPGAGTGPARTVVEQSGRRLELSLLGAVGPDELLFRVQEEQAQHDALRLQQALPLTVREADVLLWISRGKSNRDIGEILQISPRTVNKHLEQVFVKLGVENRAAAAARAVRELAR